MSDNRPPSAYLNEDDETVTLPFSFARWLDLGIDLRRLYPRAAADSEPAIRNALTALTLAANYIPDASAKGRKRIGVSAEVTSESERMSTNQAAYLIGITDRAVRDACSTGRLPADLIGGNYRITREAATTYRKGRR